MSIEEEKNTVPAQEDSKVAVTTKVVIGDEAFQQALIKEPPRMLQHPILILASFVAFCCSTSNGYDTSLFGTLLANEHFKDFFSVSNAGIEAGIVTAIYQIGGVSAIPFIGPAIDTWGRRVGMFIGSLTIVVGTIIQACCVTNASVPQFMAGRYFTGFGVAIVAAAGPVYVVELSHPAYRGVVTGLYNVMWPVGALVAAGAARGGLNYGGTTSWMIPIGLQMMFPCIILFAALFLPESPRWHFTRGQRERARNTLTRLHGGGNPESEWVKLQLTEYEEFLKMDGSDKRWWDYRSLFKTRASFYRLMCNCLVSTFGQWAGNGIVSYFLSAFLDIAGIHGSIRQTDVQLGVTATQIVFASLGATFVDRLGRRPMLITVNLVCTLCWIGMIVPCSIANVSSPDAADVENVSTSVSSAVVAFVFIFQACYSFGWTPMQALYPVEVLSFEIRAKGMAFSSLFTNAALLSNQLGVPVALERIAWRTYIIFCCWCTVQAIIIYFMMPETKNRTLEELDEIFAARNPVKKSLEKKKLDIDANKNILHVEDAGAARV
ncbi:hypothetical protein VTO42DRAFT_6533 [Malbranchea cinnamomea]